MPAAAMLEGRIDNFDCKAFLNISTHCAPTQYPLVPLTQVPAADAQKHTPMRLLPSPTRWGALARAKGAEASFAR